MPDRLNIKPETLDYFVKVFIPALAAICIKIAVEMKYKRVNLMSAFLSLVIGVLTAYITGSFILDRFPEYSTMVIALIAITSEKIAYWLIFKFNIDLLLNSITEAFKAWITKLIK